MTDHPTVMVTYRRQTKSWTIDVGKTNSWHPTDRFGSSAEQKGLDSHPVVDSPTMRDTEIGLRWIMFASWSVLLHDRSLGLPSNTSPLNRSPLHDWIL